MQQSHSHQGKSARTLIIAEAGVNHNGDQGLAEQLVRVAADSGADIVKFQTFTATALATSSAKQAAYQERNIGQSESQLDMLKRLELSHAAHHHLRKLCDQVGIEFLSTPFDFAAVDFLVNDIGVKRLKVGSGDLNNGPLVMKVVRSGVPVILSTGMASLSDIEASLGVCAFALIAGAQEKPHPEAFLAALASAEGQAAIASKISILQCTTEYPAPATAVNLRVMDSLRQAFGVPIGYSDHTKGIAVALAAVARGATIIEKHYTLDRTLPGPDHACSLEPSELHQLVQGIRDVEASLGQTTKLPSTVEWPNRAVARKSLVAARAISKGERFTVDNLTVKRPGDGLSPMLWWSVLGQVAPRDFAADALIRLDGES